MSQGSCRMCNEVHRDLESYKYAQSALGRIISWSKGQACVERGGRADGGREAAKCVLVCEKLLPSLVAPVNMKFAHLFDSA